MLNDLPIHEVLPAIRQALAAHPIVVLTAPPGSGKTTGVPLALLDEAWLGERRIVMLEPRRLAARAAAARMAASLGQAVGQTVGYQIRFESKISAATRIEVVTEGILTRRIQSDPGLEKTGLVIFDEFHERSLHADLGLALCLDLMAGLRDDLRLLIMSATLDTDALAQFLGQAPVITGTGLSYPVTVSYLERLPDQGDGLHGPRLADHIARLTAAGIRQALEERQGDILAFLPGSGEIRRAHALLAGQCSEFDIGIYPLFGDLPQAAQDRALLPSPTGKRRVVLATSIAETSLTIEGIGAVVDSGWSRVPVFDPNSGLTGLSTVRVTKAAADQRRGRAGRLGPGHCYRLWTGAIDHNLALFSQPEILLADLAPLALNLALWGVADPGRLSWLDPPPKGAFAQGRELLRDLEALDRHGHITDTGRRMAALALHPRLAYMLIVAASHGELEKACDLAALLSERDMMSNGAGSRHADIDERLEMIELYRRRGAGAVQALGVSPGICGRIVKASAEWKRTLASRKEAPRKPAGLTSAALASLGYPDRIARKRPGGGEQYLLASGRGVRLASGDPLRNSEFLAVAQLDAGRIEGRIYLAGALDLDDIRTLHGPRLRREEEVEWNEREGIVCARQVTRLAKLVIAEQTLAKPDPELVATALIDGIRRAGLAVLPWNDEARELQARILSLGKWRPDQGWPDVSEERLCETLADWLKPYLNNCRSLAQLTRLKLSEILLNLLSWPQQKLLAEGAPTHIQVPSGSRHRLHYAAGEPPVLAVRLQEMFGLADTPRVSWGQVPCLLHLLSPARRPIQITQDLKGFWDNTYHQVKRELQGRYPKHFWPDNPWEAMPTGRTKRRI